MERNALLRKNTGIGKTGMNILLYLVTIVIVCLFVYFIYKFIYGGNKFESNVILNSQIDTSTPADVTNNKDISTIPVIYEGGEFTINFWIYMSGYRTSMGNRKHLVELGVKSDNTSNNRFSTIVIALGARTPSLLVRVHTAESGSSVTGRNMFIQDCTGTSESGKKWDGNNDNNNLSTTTDNTVDLCKNACCANKDCEKYHFLPGTTGPPASAAACTLFKNTNNLTLLSDTTTTNYTAGSIRSKITDTNLMNVLADNTLLPTDITNFFTGNIVSDENSLIDSTSTCDIKELSLNKWININVSMNGKTLEIYLDGKLVKSCIYKSYFKVHNTGLYLSYLDQSKTRNLYDGFFSRLQVFNRVLNPDEIYKNYLAGPTGSSATSDPVSFIKYLFTG